MVGAGSDYFLMTGAEVVGAAGAATFLKVHFPLVYCYRAKFLSISY
jgi:hypothetical protein